MESPLTTDESKSIDSQYVPRGGGGGYSCEGNIVQEYFLLDGKQAGK